MGDNPKCFDEIKIVRTEFFAKNPVNHFSKAVENKIPIIVVDGSPFCKQFI